MPATIDRPPLPIISQRYIHTTSRFHDGAPGDDSLGFAIPQSIYGVTSLFAHLCVGVHQDTHRKLTTTVLFSVVSISKLWLWLLRLGDSLTTEALRPRYVQIVPLRK